MTLSAMPHVSHVHTLVYIIEKENTINVTCLLTAQLIEKQGISNKSIQKLIQALSRAKRENFNSNNDPFL